MLDRRWTVVSNTNLAELREESEGVGLLDMLDTSVHPQKVSNMSNTSRNVPKRVGVPGENTLDKKCPTPVQQVSNKTAGIVVAGRPFRSQSALYEALQGVIAGTPRGGSVGVWERDLVLELLPYHQHADQKTGVGIVDVKVDRHSQYATHCLWLIRADGSRVDVSIKKLVAGRFAKSVRPLDVQGILRRAVDPDRYAYKQERRAANLMTCDLTEQALTWETAHVHHNPPFQRLLSEWMAFEGLTYASFPFVPPDDVRPATCGDPELLERWVDYHRTHGRFFLVHQSVNVRLGDRPAQDDPEIAEQLIELVASARRVFMTPDGPRKEAMRDHMLRRSSAVVDRREDLLKKLESGHQWFKDNPDDPRLPEREEMWLRWMDDYVAIERALADAKAGLAN